MQPTTASWKKLPVFISIIPFYGNVFSVGVWIPTQYCKFIIKIYGSNEKHWRWRLAEYVYLPRNVKNPNKGKYFYIFPSAISCIPLRHFSRMFSNTWSFFPPTFLDEISVVPVLLRIQWGSSYLERVFAAINKSTFYNSLQHSKLNAVFSSLVLKLSDNP